MSRKSSRIQAKQNSRQPPTILSRKRKADCSLEGKNHDLQDTKRRRHSEEKCGSMAVSQTLSGLDDSSDLESVRSSGEITPCNDSLLFSTWNRFRALTCAPVTKLNRFSPLPRLSWADPKEVWALMVKKDQQYTRDHSFLDRHPALQARMRSILLDWLIEVCEVYRLHRDTYYLALDFVDRFLATQSNLPKQQLQLIGITALFVAAKIEEIYPPKLSEFAYVTDGACTESEILDKELILLKGLNWDLTPVTVHGWLNIFLQLSNVDKIQNCEDNFVFPFYSAHELVQIARLLDLCMLDIGCLQFSYSILAASALYHIVSEQIALAVSGYQWVDVARCVQWMSAFATTLREQSVIQSKFFQKVTEDDMHNIQTHTVDLQLLELAQEHLSTVMSSSCSSPLATTGLLTPPQSEEKDYVIKEGLVRS